MGIGISLATGLVQGFTRNIQEEKARRMGEQEKLDATHALVLDAALTGGEEVGRSSTTTISAEHFAFKTFKVHLIG